MLNKYGDRLKEAKADGLRIGGLEDYTAPKPKAEGPWDTVKNIHKSLFEEPLFDKIAPAIQMKKWATRKDEMIKAGLSPEEAGHAAADDANVNTGNVRLFEKSQTLRDLSRIVLFAPQWLASHGRMAGGMVNAILNPVDPRGRMYRNIMTNFALLTAAKEAISYGLTGKSTFSNISGHKTDVPIGKDDQGKDVYVRPEANSMDAFRVAIDVADAIQNNPNKLWEIVDSHMAPMTRSIMHLVQDKDHFGNPIYGHDKYGRPMDSDRQMRNVINELAQMTPSWVQAGAKSLEHLGGQPVKAPSGAEITAKALSAPVSFTTPPKPSQAIHPGSRVIYE